MDLITPGTRRWYQTSTGTIEDRTGDQSTGYIVEGRSERGQIVNTNSTMELDANANIGTPKLFQQYGIASTPTEQQRLQELNQNTNIKPSNQELFKHYPEGGPLPSSPPIRDPLIDWQEDF